ncbi:MAG: nuclear transport factor 2 family protein [Acidimicrobiales bacterium]
MGATENQALVEQWAATYNDDIEALVALYAPDAKLMGAVLGPEKLMRLEQRVLAAAPKRRMEVRRTHPSGDDVIVVEGVLTDPDQGPDWTLPFCVVLTIADGKVVRDDTYTDFSRWPGFS